MYTKTCTQHLLVSSFENMYTKYRSLKGARFVLDGLSEKNVLTLVTYIYNCGEKKKSTSQCEPFTQSCILG